MSPLPPQAVLDAAFHVTRVSTDPFLWINVYLAIGLVLSFLAFAINGALVFIGTARRCRINSATSAIIDFLVCIAAALAIGAASFLVMLVAWPLVVVCAGLVAGLFLLKSTSKRISA